MVAIEELRTTANDLGDALRRWEASRYSDESALQEAVVHHMELAPVFRALYGNIPLLVTEYPPYIIMRREKEHIAQVIGALDGGLITQEYLDGMRATQSETPGAIGDSNLGEPEKSLRALTKEGEAFSYSGFSRKGDYGYPNELSPEWASWTARVEATALPLLRQGSTAHAALVEGLSWSYLGNGEDDFLRGRSLILGALTAATDLLVSGHVSTSLAPLSPTSERVFVVHGHDDAAKSAVEQFLTEQGLVPIVLHRQPDQGMTVIEKFEQYADVGFAIVLLTPDDIAFSAATANLVPEEGALRARPNVLFEFGYFVGRLGRQRVCCLYTGNVELPSDVAGLLYKKYSQSPDEVFYELLKEFRAAGYEV